MSLQKLCFSRTLENGPLIKMEFKVHFLHIRILQSDHPSSQTFSTINFPSSLPSLFYLLLSLSLSRNHSHIHIYSQALIALPWEKTSIYQLQSFYVGVLTLSHPITSLSVSRLMPPPYSECFYTSFHLLYSPHTQGLCHSLQILTQFTPLPHVLLNSANFSGNSCPLYIFHSFLIFFFSLFSPSLRFHINHVIYSSSFQVTRYQCCNSAAIFERRWSTLCISTPFNCTASSKNLSSTFPKLKMVKKRQASCVIKETRNNIMLGMLQGSHKVKIRFFSVCHMP